MTFWGWGLKLGGRRGGGVAPEAELLPITWHGVAITWHGTAITWW